MANSLRYDQLEVRLKELEINLLPPTNATGNYSNAEIDLTRAFCLLSHAEFETYLEDILKEIVRHSFNEWKADSTKISPLLFNLVCNYKLKKDVKENAETLIHQAVKNIEEVVEKNHGIKTHNIEGLFKPIGYSIDETLVTVLHNYGKTRGDIAHTSFKTQQLLDPVTEKNNVTQIKDELKKFDDDFFKQKGNIPLLGHGGFLNWIKIKRLQITQLFKT